MIRRKTGLLSPFAFVTELCARCVTALVLLCCLVGCTGNNGQPNEPKAAVVQRTEPPSVIDAAKQVEKFEKKRTMVAAFLKKTLDEKDELMAKLREAGVSNSADLKGNLRGQKLVESLQQIGAEVEGLERQIVVIDGAILLAKAVVRRLEREKAGISDDEMRQLTEQLREAEERMDGVTRMMTPLDVETTLEWMLPNPVKPSKPPMPEAKSEPKPKESLKPQPLPNLSGRWIEDGKGVFDLTHDGNKVSWRGRSFDGGKEWTNEFQGRVQTKGDANLIAGDWKDVSPGRFTGSGKLVLLVDGNGTLRKIEETGGYAGTRWRRQIQPIPKQINLMAQKTDPAKFDGQTLLVGCDLYGSLNEGNGRFRLTLKTPGANVSGEKLSQEGINVTISKELKERWFGDLKPDRYSPVRLTVTVRQEGMERWFAIVSDVEWEKR